VSEFRRSLYSFVAFRYIRTAAKFDSFMFQMLSYLSIGENYIYSRCIDVADAISGVR
jgi:hypothetical protein